MRYGILLVLLLSVFVSAGNSGESNTPSESDSSVCDLLLDREGAFLYTLEKGESRLRRRFEDGSSPDEILPLPADPARMTFTPDETQILISGGIGPGNLFLVRVKDDSGKPVPLTLEKSFAAGHSPESVAALQREEGLRFYAADRFLGKVREFDGATGEALRVFDAGREPSALKAAPDRKTLAVANLLPEYRADTSFTTSRVRLIDLESGEITPIDLHNGTANLYDLDISPDGRFAVVTGTNANYHTVTSQVIDGWIVHNIISVIDIPAKRFVDMVYLDNTYCGAPNPWGISYGEDGKYIAIALSGSGEVLFLSVESLMATLGSRLGEGAPAPAAKGIDPLRYRVQLGLRGTRRVLLRGNTAWVTAYFDSAVGKVTLNTAPPLGKPYFAPRDIPAPPDPDRAEKDTPPSANWIPLPDFSPMPGVLFTRSFTRLAPKRSESAVRRGEYLFCSALHCEEEWQSCITCHPDGRADALSWDLENDGVGNPKNTKSLLLAHETPPSMITGVRADAETAVRAGVVHILFGTLPEEDYCAIDEYLKSLRPLPSPYLENGKLSEKARRGKILFESSRTGCSGCHPEPLFTDLSMHATGSQDYKEPRLKFDTPTLVEVWRTAPYLSTGHWLTLREMLAEGKHPSRGGQSADLSPQELDDLIEYVLSL